MENSGVPAGGPAWMFWGRFFGTPATHLRSIAVLEGISYLVLLFIAMPLKYLGDMPLAVRVVGSAHGALFVWLGLLVLAGLMRRGRSMGWAAKIMVASLIPFGTFVIDRSLRDEIDVEATRATRSWTSTRGSSTRCSSG